MPRGFACSQKRNEENMTDYKASDDIPCSFWGKEKNKLTRVQQRIASMAAEMGIVLTLSEIQKFALILVAIAERRGR
jgi:hypothetical protein